MRQPDALEENPFFLGAEPARGVKNRLRSEKGE